MAQSSVTIIPSSDPQSKYGTVHSKGFYFNFPSTCYLGFVWNHSVLSPPLFKADIILNSSRYFLAPFLVGLANTFPLWEPIGDHNNSLTLRCSGLNSVYSWEYYALAENKTRMTVSHQWRGRRTSRAEGRPVFEMSHCNMMLKKYHNPAAFSPLVICTSFPPVGTEHLHVEGGLSHA